MPGPLYSTELRKTTVAFLILVVLSIAVSACSSAENEDGTASPRSEAVTPTDPVTGDSTAPLGDNVAPQTNRPTDFPCTLLTDAQVSSLAENELTGRARTSRISEGTITFNATECLWEPAQATTEEAQNAVTEIYLQVSEPADFRSGEVTCHPLPNATGTVEDLNDNAEWAWTQKDGSTKLGKLRVCTEVALYTVAVAGADDEPRLKSIATSIATQAIGTT